MRGVVMHSAGDVRVEDREDPRIIEPTDAIVRLTATCVCGSDLWPYRGIEPANHPPLTLCSTHSATALQRPALW
jgi:threonine dehydrogenase-like Zn-dependent dehydrogenase